MHIVVTGTSGRIGAAVAEQLLTRDHVATGLDLVEPRERLPGLDYVVGDLADLPRTDPGWPVWMRSQHPRRPTTWYGGTKVLAEDMVEFAGRKLGWSTVCLRFSHTQHPAEILDPDSFFSGPRFFASRRLLRERVNGNDPVVAQLAPNEGDDSVLLAARREDGEPVRMGIPAQAPLSAGRPRRIRLPDR
jgi:nucleoside-diphosphate-sugar epimerase